MMIPAMRAPNASLERPPSLGGAVVVGDDEVAAKEVPISEELMQEMSGKRKKRKVGKERLVHCDGLCACSTI